MMSSVSDFDSERNAAFKSEYPHIRVAFFAASVMFAFFYLLAEIFLRHRVLQDGDTFLHISVGRWILQHGRFPVLDMFSHTASGQVWRATDWIAEVGLAILYQLGKWSGVTEAVSVSIALLAAILSFYLAQKLRLSVAIGLTAIIMVGISPHFLARPLIFSYPLLLIWVLAILNIDDRQRWSEPSAYILIPIMLLWANLYAGFTLGLAIFGFFVSNAIYTAYRNNDRSSIKKLMVLGCGVAVASTITPYGIFSALKTVSLLGISDLSIVTEWAPPVFQQDPFHLVCVVGLFTLGLYFGMRLRGPRLLTLVLITVLALEHRRGLGLFSLVAPLVILPAFTESMPWMSVAGDVDNPVPAFAAKHSGTISSICAVLVIFGGLSMWLWGPRIQLPERVAPAAAIAAAERAHVHGNVLNTYKFGGYLIFKGMHPFIDGRVGLYGGKFIKQYFALLEGENPGETPEFLRRYNVQWALLHPGAQIAYVLRTIGWQKIYEDKYALVLAKRS